jgi:hypothetical protein
MESIVLALECESDAADALAAALSEATQSEVTSAEKNSLDGSPATVLQIVQIATSLAAAVTPLVAAYIDLRRVKKIKFGSIEIENPTQEQWERLWNDYLVSEREASSGRLA